MTCSHAATVRYPVPDEAGFGITIESLYSSLVRSAQLAGFAFLPFAASAVLKQITDRKASMPTQVSGVLPLLNIGLSAAAPAGV
jgi:hypothetical protein